LLLTIDCRLFVTNLCLQVVVLQQYFTSMELILLFDLEHSYRLLVSILKFLFGNGMKFQRRCNEGDILLSMKVVIFIGGDFTIS